MRSDKTEDGRKKRNLYDVKPFVVIVALCNGVTHPNIEHEEEAT